MAPRESPQVAGPRVGHGAADGLGSRRAVADLVTADLADVAEAVVAEMVRQIPAYGVLGPDQLRDVRRIAHWGIGRLLWAWAHDAGLDHADLATFRRIGQARAMDGRPLAAVLRSYRIAGVLVWRAIVERAGPRLATADALAWTELWLGTIDDVTEAINEGYVAAAERLSTDRDRARADLLDDILHGRHARVGGLAEHCAALGYRLPERAVLVVLCQGPSADPVTAEALGPLGAAARVEPADQLLRAGSGRGVALLPSCDAGGSAAIVAHLASRGWRAVVLDDRPAGELPRSFRLAEDALAAAPEWAFPPHGCLDAGDAELLAVLHARPEADPERMVAEVLGELVEADHDRLLAGLAAYVVTGSARAAAARLALHPQTLRYRLRRVAQLTGRDPRLPWNRFAFEIALATRAAWVARRPATPAR